jgi:peptide/nickel transport system ATP-binding protein
MPETGGQAPLPETTRETAAKPGPAGRPAEAVLRAESLTKYYRVREHTVRSVAHRRVVHAVDGISFELYGGTSVALVGESGSGKSTAGRVAAGLEPPTSGRVLFKGQTLNVRSRSAMERYRSEVQLIFQDPYASLNPVHTVAYHLERPLRIHKMVGSTREVRPRVLELLEEVHLTPASQVIDKLPHELSGGQRQRVAIARTLAVRPSILVADEPVSMLDVSVRLSILNLLAELVQQQNLALLYITHDIASARYFAERLLVMYAGEVVEAGPAEEITQSPAHPYTQLLVSAAPDPDASAHGGRQPMLAPGENPSLINPPAGCRFHPRCPRAMDICAREQPAKFAINDAHWAACWLFRDHRPAEALPSPEPPVRHTGPGGTVQEPAPATGTTPGQVSKGANHGN